MSEGVVYLNPAHVLAKRRTKAPPNRSQTGYGNKIPTSWELQLQDKRWRRVYVICYSNSGSPYVLVDGKSQFLGSYDPSYDPPGGSGGGGARGHRRGGGGASTAAVVYRPPGSHKMPDNAAYTNRFQIKSETSDRLYTVAQSKTGRWWACSCPAWITRKQCKHLTAMRLPGHHEPYEALLK